MKKIIHLSLLILIFVFILMGNLYASNDDPLSDCEQLKLEDPLLKITEKVLVFLKNNPSKNNLTINELLRDKVITAEDFEFLFKHNIKYNPPSSAGPHDNYLSIFDRDNEDGTSTHILYDLVDRSDPSITQTGEISELTKFMTEWFEYKSKKKSLSLFKGESVRYFTLCYWDNDYWDKQHIMLIDLPANEKEKIDKFKQLMIAYKVQYEENNYQDYLSISILLPNNLSIIKKFSYDILASIFRVSKKDEVNYIPDGFRFKVAADKK